MTDICIENMNEIVDIIADEANKLHKYDSIGVIAYYEDMTEILQKLLTRNFKVDDIILNNYKYDGYDKEYILVFNHDHKIRVLPMYQNNKYINYDIYTVFVADDCSQKVIDCNLRKCADTYIFGYEEDEESCDCENCQCCDDTDDDTDDDMHGFSVTSSDENGISTYSFYSTDINLVKEFAERFKK